MAKKKVKPKTGGTKAPPTTGQVQTYLMNKARGGAQLSSSERAKLNPKQIQKLINEKQLGSGVNNPSQSDLLQTPGKVVDTPAGPILVPLSDPRPATAGTGPGSGNVSGPATGGTGIVGVVEGVA